MTLTVTPIQQDGYEEVVSFSDDDFQCFIAIHNTKLGPALGGCRVKSYASSDDALLDVLRLSKGMSYKSSLANLNLGGGKCVVMAHHTTPDMMHKVGEAVNYFAGRYITAEDIGTTLSDIHTVAEVSQYTAHIDGSSNTARGVFACMKAALAYQDRWAIGSTVAEVPIWIQGLGKVGWDLFTRILEELPDWVRAGGSNLYVSDIRPEVIEKALSFKANEIKESDKKFMAVYAPCAMGQVVNATNVDTSSYPIICGSANNQLVTEDYAEMLQSRDILYCPDYLVNAGGVITAAGEIEGWSTAEIELRCDDLSDRLLEVFDEAEKTNQTPLAAANAMAEKRFE